MEDNEGLFACSKCHGRFPFENLSRNEHLCKNCRHANPAAQCVYCRLEFHLTKKGKTPVCQGCDSSFAIHGKPKSCQYCNIRAAFGGSICNRCKSSEKKYGSPVQCDHCKLTCAFKRPKEALKKVDGKQLCLLCTITYRRAQYQQKKLMKRKGNGVKEEKVSNTPVNDNPLKQFYVSQPKETLAIANAVPSNVVELAKLREELLAMKQQIQQKDKLLIEKEKQITELKAEKWIYEKEWRLKVSNLQKKHMETLKIQQEEIHSLKKQNSKAKLTNARVS